MITKLLVVKQHPDGGLIKIYDEEWFYAIRAAERRAKPGTRRSRATVLRSILADKGAADPRNGSLWCG